MKNIGLIFILLVSISQAQDVIQCLGERLVETNNYTVTVIDDRTGETNFVQKTVVSGNTEEMNRKAWWINNNIDPATAVVVTGSDVTLPSGKVVPLSKVRDIVFRITGDESLTGTIVIDGTTYDKTLAIKYLLIIYDFAREHSGNKLPNKTDVLKSVKRELKRRNP